MPAKDQHHDTVVRALIKDGWTITKEQYVIDLIERHLFIDLEAQRNVESLVILVEIKGFESMPSPMSYFADTIGQYILYRTALKMAKVSAPLYLAVPIDAYTGILAEPLPEKVLIDENINVLVFDVVREEIIRWIRR